MCNKVGRHSRISSIMVFNIMLLKINMFRTLYYIHEISWLHSNCVEKMHMHGIPLYFVWYKERRQKKDNENQCLRFSRKVVNCFENNSTQLFSCSIHIFFTTTHTHIIIYQYLIIRYFGQGMAYNYTRAGYNNMCLFVCNIAL